jgi:hypothetical protein
MSGSISEKSGSVPAAASFSKSANGSVQGYLTRRS